MTRDVFRTYCAEKISGILNQLTSVKWSMEGTIDGKSRIDVLGKNEEVVYLLEIEMRREDPVNNVIKIWRMIEEGLEGRTPKKIIFIHVFSGFYKSRSMKIENAKFAGKKMAEAIENVEYKTIRLHLIPPVAGKIFPENTDEEIQILCNEIASLISAFEQFSA